MSKTPGNTELSQKQVNGDALSVLTVHLDAVRQNYLLLQKKLARGSDCAAVVKADAYGLGATAVAPVLFEANCRHFYVAHAREGLAVRAALGDLEAHVYVFHGAHGIAAEEMLRYKLTPVLNTPGDIAEWAHLARQLGKKLPAVIHIDTGMNRLGLGAQEVSALKAEELRALDIRYVMSHLACADEPYHPLNVRQLESFKFLAGGLDVPARLSFANSSGIFLGSDYHFDQARPGCALYGINPQPGQPNPMQRTVTLQLRILQIREAAAGETVGYGGGCKLARASRLATISAGYADGILRSATERGMVYINGQKCPIAGRVSMDTIIVDITGLTGPVAVGDYAEVLGPHQGPDDLAAQAGTIGYEILTGLGRRYRRVYTGQQDT